MITVCLFAMACSAEGSGASGDRYAAARRRMVAEDLMGRDIRDPAVLGAMEKVPRHLFVDERFGPEAYDDHPLPIGQGQTISQPYIVALMTQCLSLKPSDRVLEIGTGCGYQAAVLAELAGRVYTIELEKQLADQAGRLLQKLGYDRVQVRCGDGFFGWADEAPFDAIMVTCAPEKIPQPLIDQLREGGRIVAPIGGVLQVQELVFGTKKNGKFSQQILIPVRFVPMRGEAEKSFK